MEPIEFLPVVKAYPALSSTYGEVSCIAGIRTDGPTAPEWIRLYPVPFRALDDTQQFAKYQPITLRVESHRGDLRPETRRPDRDSIQQLRSTISSRDGWRLRRPFVERLMADSMCEVQRQQKKRGVSLAVFRPREVVDLVIQPASINAEKTAIARAWAAQSSLLDGVASDERQQQLKALELIPWSFKYHYFCTDPRCKGHTQSIIDWEIAAFYRRIQRRVNWQERMRERWIGELCAPDRDTAFFVGNQHQHPTAFLVLGVWWPERRQEQLGLTGM
jgi:hypothetical protein